MSRSATCKDKARETKASSQENVTLTETLSACARCRYAPAPRPWDSHTTNPLQPEEQYAGCAFKNKTTRGAFGDALAEVDSIVGDIVASLEQNGLEKNTLVIFSSDNGPWMVKAESGGSPGIMYGRSSGYWNVGKGSTWEGGIHEPAFARWPGKCNDFERKRSRSETLIARELELTEGLLARACGCAPPHPRSWEQGPSPRSPRATRSSRAWTFSRR